MTTAKSSTKKTHKTRTAEQRVADLEAEIAKVKEREATKELRADPAIKLTSAAVRALNKAIGEAKDAELVEVLKGARGALSGYLEKKGPLTRVLHWKIDNYPSIDHFYQENQFIVSQQFTLDNGTNWNLILYPKGQTNTEGPGCRAGEGHASLHLQFGLDQR